MTRKENYKSISYMNMTTTPSTNYYQMTSKKVQKDYLSRPRGTYSIHTSLVHFKINVFTLLYQSAKKKSHMILIMAEKHLIKLNTHFLLKGNFLILVRKWTHILQLTACCVGRTDAFQSLGSSNVAPEPLYSVPLGRHLL